MQEPRAFLNGKWIPASKAAVAVEDAGFVLGATVTEQLRTFAGKVFRLDDHLARLQRSMEIVGIEPDMTMGQLAEVAGELVERNHRLLADGDDLGVCVFVTPGAYPAFSSPAPGRPTVCLHTYPLPFRLWAQKYRVGQALVTTEIQQVPSRCWPAALKCRSRMHYYLSDRRAAAIEPGARAVLLDEHGFVTETSTANVLIHRASQGLISPPLGKILRGISLTVVFELAEQLGIPTLEQELTAEAVSAADEVMLSSTPLCVLPVTRFNGRPIGTGGPGEVYRRLLAAWSELVGVDIVGQAERFADRG